MNRSTTSAIDFYSAGLSRACHIADTAESLELREDALCFADELVEQLDYFRITVGHLNTCFALEDHL